MQTPTAASRKLTKLWPLAAVQAQTAPWLYRQQSGPPPDPISHCPYLFRSASVSPLYQPVLTHHKGALLCGIRFAYYYHFLEIPKYIFYSHFVISLHQ